MTSSPDPGAPPPPPTGTDGWYVARDGQTYGPYSWNEVVDHTRGGRIGARDKLFDPRSGTWAKPSKVPGLLGRDGAAVIPAGLSAAAKIAVGVVITGAALIAAFFVIQSMTPTATVKQNVGSAIVQQGDAASSTSPTVVMAPEGLTFRGTFTWESKERDAPGGTLTHGSTCYLWIYTTDDGTAADFSFGEYLVDGWPVYLVSRSGSRYVFESSTRSLVERVRITVDTTGTRISGTVVNITPDISSFSRGTFSGETISFAQYDAEVRS